MVNRNKTHIKMKVNELRKEVRNSLLTSLEMLNESSNLPSGAENDPRAPYNQGDDPEISSLRVDYNNQQFHVEFGGREISVDFIDVLELYWKKYPNSFEQQHAKFPEDENIDRNIVQDLVAQNFDFTELCQQVVERDSNNFPSDQSEMDFQ